jgi:heme A synthase
MQARRYDREEHDMRKNPKKARTALLLSYLLLAAVLAVGAAVGTAWAGEPVGIELGP